jgi:hypothetical protein
MSIVQLVGPAKPFPYGLPEPVMAYGLLLSLSPEAQTMTMMKKMMIGIRTKTKITMVTTRATATRSDQMLA